MAPIKTSHIWACIDDQEIEGKAGSLDVAGADSIEILLSVNRKNLWINKREHCLLRVWDMRGIVMLDDMRDHSGRQCGCRLSVDHVDGNVWSASNAWRAVGDGGAIDFNPEGKLVGRIRLPEICGNVYFGSTQAKPAVRGKRVSGLRVLHRAGAALTRPRSLG